MIIVIGGIKGGGGKTTLATNLAVIRSSINSKKVLLVDADDQRSTTDWAEHRESIGVTTPFTTICLTGSAVKNQVYKMMNDYDDIIIDTGGRDTSSQRAALMIADIFLAPFQPRSLDVWTVGKVSTLVRDAQDINGKLVAYAVINRADSQGTDNAAAGEIIQAEGLHLIDVRIGQRKAFSNAASEGLSVIELKYKDEKANAEILKLSEIIFNCKIAVSLASV